MNLLRDIPPCEDRDWVEMLAQREGWDRAHRLVGATLARRRTLRLLASTSAAVR